MQLQRTTNVGSLLCVPVMASERVLGVLSVASEHALGVCSYASVFRIFVNGCRALQIAQGMCIMHGLLWCGKCWPLYCGKVAVQHALSDTVGFCSAQKKLETFARILAPALSCRRHGSEAKVLPARLPHPLTCHKQAMFQY